MKRMELNNNQLKYVTGGEDDTDSKIHYIHSIIDPETTDDIDEKDKEEFIKKYLRER